MASDGRMRGVVNPAEKVMINLRAVLVAMVLGSGICAAPTVRAQEDPSLVGQWSPVQDWPEEAIHAVMLPTGEVLFWGRFPHIQEFHLWDPETDQISEAGNPQRNLYCSGTAFQPDGTLLVSGGHIQSDVGLDTTTIYDPYTDSWTNGPNMSGGRWYPSTTTLANGDVLASYGNDGNDNIVINELPEVFELESTDWRALTSAELPLEPLATWYPRTFLAPDGRVFFATPTSRLLDTSGTGTWTDVAIRNDSARDWYGAAVMYDDGKVLFAGGGDPPTETCEMINLKDPIPSWQNTGSMAQPRRQNNLTLLPDGKVLVTGGSSLPGFNNKDGAVYYAEMWDPSTGQWTPRASYERFRGNHSTALLLPDARVLSAGGDNQPNAEVYSPPYLFWGMRPKINFVPTSIDYGETFFVEISDIADATDIVAVNMLRSGSTTHMHNFDQRICRVEYAIDSFDVGSTIAQLSVSAPALATDCPPGPYMLFVLNSSGVPSVAEILLLGGNTAPLADAGPDQPVTDSDNNGWEQVTLDGTGSTDPDGTITSYDWSLGAVFGPTDISFPPDPALPGPQTRSQTLEVDAQGFENLTVSFTIQGIADIEPDCPDGVDSDCWQLFENADPIVGPPGLGIPLSETPFTFPLASADTIFDLTFLLELTAGHGEGAVFRMITVEGDPIAATASTFSGPTPTVTLAEGVHTMTLTVTDDDGATDTDIVVVTVESPTANPQPVANAGPDQPVSDIDNDGSEQVALDGTGSTDDGAIVLYQWSDDLGDPIADGSGPTPTLIVGVHTITLTVTDDDGATDTDTVVVTVTPNVMPPAAPSGVAANPGATDGTADIIWLDNSANETGFEVQRETKHKKRDSWNGATVVAVTAADQTSATDTSGSGTFRYRVRAANGAGVSDWSVWAEVTTTSGGGGGGGGGGGTKPCRGKKCET